MKEKTCFFAIVATSVFCCGCVSKVVPEETATKNIAVGRYVVGNETHFTRSAMIKLQGEKSFFGWPLTSSDQWYFVYMRRREEQPVNCPENSPVYHEEIVPRERLISVTYNPSEFDIPMDLSYPKPPIESVTAFEPANK